MRVAMLAVTKGGVAMASRLKEQYPEWDAHAPAKFEGTGDGITWFSEPASEKVGALFGQYEALVCMFSLGAVIRLIAPHLRDKKTDPAVIVIDDKAEHVISALSGHIGGANRLATEIADKLGSDPVITTAADVNKTIAVDMVGREFGWSIEDGSKVTAASACMVNGEPVGIYQDAGRRDWYGARLPENAAIYETLGQLASSGCRAAMIISDKIADQALPNAVTYRPPSLVIGIGLHQDTTEQTIRDGISKTLARHRLSPASVAKIATIKKPKDVQGLADYAAGLGIPVEYVDRQDLAKVAAPNPSDTVAAFEGTASVSEAAAIICSGGRLAVEKQKFPPDLTVAIARVK